ncbi:MAG: MoaD/ThiS family protein [Anaerolineaceae bacterium]|nr:MoaD/ThiS family protein [Anaerolineaceae bacterium]
MKLYLGGHLNFYHPQKEKWLEININQPIPLIEILGEAGIPLSEINLIAVNDEMVELKDAIISNKDEVKIFSAVGGG